MHQSGHNLQARPYSKLTCACSYKLLCVETAGSELITSAPRVRRFLSCASRHCCVRVAALHRGYKLRHAHAGKSLGDTVSAQRSLPDESQRQKPIPETSWWHDWRSFSVGGWHGRLCSTQDGLQVLKSVATCVPTGSLLCQILKILAPSRRTRVSSSIQQAFRTCKEPNRRMTNSLLALNGCMFAAQALSGGAVTKWGIKVSSHTTHTV